MNWLLLARKNRVHHGCFLLTEDETDNGERGKTGVRKVTTLPYKFVLSFPPK
jgi:hypothetical protein